MNTQCIDLFNLSKKVENKAVWFSPLGDGGGGASRHENWRSSKQLSQGIIHLFSLPKAIQPQRQLPEALPHTHGRKALSVPQMSLQSHTESSLDLTHAGQTW